MTTSLWADAHITGDCDNPANAIGETDGVWTSDSGAESWTSRWSMENPSKVLAATQTINVLARKEDVATAAPTISIDLYEAGNFVRELVGTTEITSTTGQTVTGTFEPSEISDPKQVEIRIVATHDTVLAVSSTVQIDSIEWAALFRRTRLYTGLCVT